MNITASKNIGYPMSQASPSVAPKAAASEQAPAAILDSFSFASSLDIKHGAIAGVLGVVPLIGAATNFGLGVEDQFNGRGSTGSTVGLLSNLAGTATLVGGALFSSSTAMNIGLGMLGLSGLTAAYAGAT